MIRLMRCGHISFKFMLFIMASLTKIEIKAVFAFIDFSFRNIHLTKCAFYSFFLYITIWLDFNIHFMARFMVFRINIFRIIFNKKTTLAYFFKKITFLIYKNLHREKLLHTVQEKHGPMIGF